MNISEIYKKKKIKKKLNVLTTDWVYTLTSESISSKIFVTTYNILERNFIIIYNPPPHTQKSL